MARMRTLKPEFWDSPSTARASLAARLLFLAMWNWADDSGRGTAGLKELEAFAFPNDDVKEFRRNSAGNSGPMAGGSPELYGGFAEVCGDVAEAYGVMFYRVKARPYYAIPSFKAHQAKDFRPSSKYPLEHEGEFFDVTSGNVIYPDVETGQETGERGTPAHDAGNSGPMAGTRPVVIGEQGKRVIGEQGSNYMPTGSAAERVIDAEVIEDEPKPTAKAEPNRFDEFWDAYPRKMGKQKAVAKFKAATKRADAQQIIDGAHRLANDPNLPEPTFIPHPTTWLERNGWEDEALPQRSSGPRNRSTDRMLNGFDAMAGYQGAPQPDPWAGKELNR